MSRPCHGPMPGRILACGRPCHGRITGLVDSVAAHARPCRSARPAVSRSVPRAPCLRSPTRSAAHITASCTVSWCFPRPCRACIATQPSGQAACLSRYTHSHRDTVPQQPGPGVRAARPCARADRVVAYIMALPRCVMGVAWPYRGHPAARPNEPQRAPALPLSLACHDTIYCIVTQHQNGQ